MKIKTPFSLLLAVVCMFTLSSSAQSTPGKLLLAKGQKIKIDNNIKSVINQEMMGQTMEITSDANSVYVVEVKEKKKNSYLVSSTLTKLSTSGKAMGQEMNFDSDKKEDLESETGKALKDQLNVSKESELNESARVIKGVEKDTSTSAGGPMADMMKRFTSAGGDESNGAIAAFEVIPPGKKVGDSWDDSTITEEVKTYMNYNLKEVNGNNATIVISGKQITKMKVEQQGMEINISMEGKISGEGTVDVKTGLVKQKTTVLDGTGSTEVMGQNIPNTIKVTTVTTVTTI